MRPRSADQADDLVAVQVEAHLVKRAHALEVERHGSGPEKTSGPLLLAADSTSVIPCLASDVRR